MNTCRVTAAVAALSAALLFAPVTAPAADRSVPGQDLYRDHCKSCHAPGSPHGEYTPLTLIQDQWNRFFDRKYQRTHEGVADPAHGGKPVTEVISPEMLEKIRQFAVEHAADSESPMTCG